MTGWLKVIGLGPGAAELVTPEVTAALGAATDLVGYAPYLARVPDRDGQTRHGSDNRVELDRATHALRLAAAGRRVALISSGDPGVFAMASALFEALEAGEPGWAALDIEVLPGVSAMLAAASRLGAPLGGDFCVLNLSDNLKPWDLIEKRLRLAAAADFAIALYNPVSKARPAGLDRAFAVLGETKAAETPVMFATAVSAPQEAIDIVPLGEAMGARADMRTLVIVGASTTRLIPRPGRRPFVYTPRSVRSG